MLFGFQRCVKQNDMPERTAEIGSFQTDMSARSELPKFLLCPNCKGRYNDNKKRRVIDSCGHPRCFSCLTKDESCPLCERIKISAGSQWPSIGEPAIESRGRPDKIRTSSVSAMMGRSLSCGADIRRKKAASLSIVDKINSLSQIELRKGIKMKDGGSLNACNSNVCDAFKDPITTASPPDGNMIQLSVQAKKIDRKASFSSILSRNSESFKHSLFRRSSSFSASSKQLESNSEAPQEFESRLKILARPRPRSLSSMEYVKWNSLSFLPSMRENKEFVGSESPPRKTSSISDDAKCEEKRRFMENVITRASLWLEESRNTLNRRSSVFGKDEVPEKDTGSNEGEAENVCRVSTSSIELNRGQKLEDSVVGETCLEEDSSEKEIKEKNGCCTSVCGGDLSTNSENLGQDIKRLGAKKTSSSDAEMQLCQSINVGNQIKDYAGSENSSDGYSSDTGSFSFSDSDSSISEFHFNRVFEDCSCEEDINNGLINQKASSSREDIGTNSIISDFVTSKSENNLLDVRGRTSSQDDEDSSYLPAIRELLYGRLKKEKNPAVVRLSPRRFGTCENPFSKSSVLEDEKLPQNDSRLIADRNMSKNGAGVYCETEINNSQSFSGNKSKQLIGNAENNIDALENRTNVDTSKQINGNNKMFPFDSVNVNSNGGYASGISRESSLGKGRELSAFQQGNDVRESDVRRCESDAGNKGVKTDEFETTSNEQSTKTSELKASKVEQNERWIAEKHAATNRTENIRLRRSVTGSTHKKASWSTSDLLPAIEYLPSLKKNRRKRPNSLSYGHLKWYPELIPNETDVDSFCKDSERLRDPFDEETLTAVMACQGLETVETNVFVTENGRERIDESGIEMKTCLMVDSRNDQGTDPELNRSITTVRHNTAEGSAESLSKPDEFMDSAEVVNRSTAHQGSSISANIVQEDEIVVSNIEILCDHGSDVMEEPNLVFGVVNRDTLETEVEQVNTRNGDSSEMATRHSAPVVAKSERLSYKTTKFSNFKHGKHGDIGKMKLNTSSIPESIQAGFIHEDDLIRNKTDDWKTANSHMLKNRTKMDVALKNSKSLAGSNDTTPVVFIAEKDLKEPVFVGNRNKHRKSKQNNKVKSSVIPREAAGGKKSLQGVGATKRISEKARNPSMPHSIKFIKDKIHKLTKWSKRGNCMDNEDTGTTVVFNDKNSTIKSSTPENASKCIVQASDGFVDKLKNIEQHENSDFNQNILRLSDNINDSNLKHTSLEGSDVPTPHKDTADNASFSRIPQGSHQAPSLIKQQNQGIGDMEIDQASLTSVSTLNFTPPKRLINFDESSLSLTDSDSDDSTLSSRFSLLSDTDSSSDTISTSIKDTDMPDFRSPSRIQEDLAALLERKVTRKRQGLNEIDFRSMMPSSKGKSLIPREWLYDIVHRLLLARDTQGTSNTRGIIISANNGCGKTTLLRTMIWNSQSDRFGSKTRERIAGSVLCHHFCFNSDIETTSVAKFVLNMAASLVDKDEFSGYTKKISESTEIRKYLNSGSVEREPEKAFREGILKPLNSMFRERSNSNRHAVKQYLFVVDIEDHCCTSCRTDECIATMLAENIDLLPKRIKLVVAGTKQSVQALQATDKLHEISLDNIANWDVQSDLYNFAEMTVQKMPNGDLSKAKIRKLLDNVVKFSQGSFDIASMAIHYVTSSSSRLPSLKSLEKDGLFRETLKLKFGATERGRILALSLLDVLCVSQEPFTLSNLFKVVEYGCSSQPVTFQEFESCIDTLVAVQMISESVEGRFSATERTRNCLVEALSGSNLRKGNNLLSLHYMKTLNSYSGKDVYRLAYHLALSSFGEEIEDGESRMSFLAWTLTQVFKDTTAGFLEACNIYHPIPEVYHLFLHTDIDDKMFERKYGSDRIVMAASLMQPQIARLLLGHKQFSKETLDAAFKEAIRTGSSEIVDLLLERKADQSLNEASYFETALENHQLSIAMQLLSTDWPVEQQHLRKAAAQRTLCEACKVGDLEIIKDLCRRVDLIDVNEVDMRGRIPLIYAIEHKHMEAIRLLIENEACVNIRDKEGMTPLLTAVSLNYEEIVDLLIDEDAEIDMKDKNGKTPLMLAASQNHARVVDTLFMEGGSINHEDDYGHSALALACMNGAAKAVRSLLVNRAMVDKMDNSQRTPLHHACVNGNAEIVQLLLDHGADVNHKDVEGLKPIEKAICAENFKVVKVLLKNDAVVRKSCWTLAEQSLDGFLCLINYFEKKGNSMIKAGRYADANSYFQRAVNKIESSKHKTNKMVLRTKLLCQQDSRLKFPKS